MPVSVLGRPADRQQTTVATIVDDVMTMRMDTSGVGSSEFSNKPEDMLVTISSSAADASSEAAKAGMVVVGDVEQQADLPRLSARSSPSNGTSSSSSSLNREDFQAQLKKQVLMSWQGHKGFENALLLVCERLLELEQRSYKLQEDQKTAEASHFQLRDECLERNQHLVGLNNEVRQGLSKLETRLDSLTTSPSSPSTSGGKVQTEPVERTEMMDAHRSDVTNSGKQKSNVEKEGDTEEITVEETRIELLSVAQSHVGTGGCKGTPGGENSPELRESATSVRHIQDDESVTSITSPRRAQAKKRWIKVRKNCAFLASQTGRQIMAEPMNYQAEAIEARVGRLEQAVGVSADTKGPSRLDTLARDVRLSLAMVVEYQARAASDTLSTPLCLFPAETRDMSLLALAMPSSHRGGALLEDDSKRCRSYTSRKSESDAISASVGDGGSEEEQGGGDVGWLWMAEDGGYLCVDMLLERTIEELKEGLAFAASHVEQLTGAGPAAGSSTGTGKSSKNPLSSNVSVSGTRLKKEMERMQDRCERLEALVAEVGRRQKADREERGCQPENSVFASIEPNPQSEGEAEAAAAAAASSEILRLSCALAVDMQYVLSNQEYCHVFDAFSFTPERKCLCGRQFDDTIASPRAGRDVNGKAETAVPRNPPCRPPRTARPTGVTGADTQPFDDSSESGTMARFRPCRRSVVMTLEVAADRKGPSASSTTVARNDADRGRRGGDNDTFIGGEAGVETRRERQGQQNRHHDDEGDPRPSIKEGGAQMTAARPTLYQCLVLSLGHLSSFIAAARSRVVHRAATSLKVDVTAAKDAARKAVAAARSAQSVARQASAEALAATARAASAAASARNEGSILLEEVHGQLAKAIEHERGRLELANDERAKAEMERVSHLLESQLGHLRSLLDSKAGQEDLSSITKAMGDVEETLTVVRQSLPAENVMFELQEALSRKADKSYTKRQIALLVSKVSEMLKADVDEPTMAKKKCLSCDRVFNKASFVELAQQGQLPIALNKTEDETAGTVSASNTQDRENDFNHPQGADGFGEAGPVTRRQVYTAGEGTSIGEGRGGQGARRSPIRGDSRPGSAPSKRPSIDPRSTPKTGKRLDRPSSARPGSNDNSQWNTSVPPGTFAGGFRPNSAGAVRSKARSHNVPPTHSSSQLFPPTALSATMGPLSAGVRKAIENEVAKTERVFALEPVPAPDHLRYGGMTAAPLVRQLFANIGGTAKNRRAARGRSTPEKRGGGGRGSGRGTDSGQRARERAGRRRQEEGEQGGDSHDGEVISPWDTRETVAQDGQRTGASVSSTSVAGGALRNRPLSPAKRDARGNDGYPGGNGSNSAKGVTRRGAEVDGQNDHEFTSTLEHHKRNMIATAAPPVDTPGPPDSFRGSDGGGSTWTGF